jgi:hypothetical protein
MIDEDICETPVESRTINANVKEQLKSAKGCINLLGDVIQPEWFEIDNHLQMLDNIFKEDQQAVSLL